LLAVFVEYKGVWRALLAQLRTAANPLSARCAFGIVKRYHWGAGR